MVGSVCGGGELSLGVTWRRLYDERIIVDIYIGGGIDVQNGSLTSSVTALRIMISGDSIGGHHVRHVPAPRALYDLTVLRCLIHLYVAHKLLDILDIRHIVITGMLVLLRVLDEGLRTV